MRLLVLGGTWFLGRHIAERAIGRGWDVTTFNRGRSGVDVPGVDRVRGDRTVVDDVQRLLAHGRWDAVVDTSSTDLSPRDVLLAASTLRDTAGRWVHVSTVSVYAGWPCQPLSEESELLECPADADEMYGGAGEDGSPTPYGLHQAVPYGLHQAGAERAVEEAFGERSVFLRPGVVLGPGEYLGRLPWWLNRARRGGRLLAPAPADRRIRPVDVRDAAAFALDQAAGAASGGFNLVHPEGIAFGDFVAACLSVTGGAGGAGRADGAGEPQWAQPELLAEHGVRPWTELPLWRTEASAWAVGSRRAVAAGLRCRPVADTIRDTWSWWEGGGRPVGHPRWAEHGLAPDKEARILAAL
ncbi:NAD-dependent epimerase/dehydratase family protein [Streptomyces sp. NPDC051907]|uniref:NAD-dependent epimerase/dehydratase family protein n=1 Tax=Streptomyces sp. NPDC051907 TaxID=3155284 RepID=UPI0034133A55